MRLLLLSPLYGTMGAVLLIEARAIARRSVGGVAVASSFAPGARAAAG